MSNTAHAPDYILKKELPDTSVGTKLFFQDGIYYYKNDLEEDRFFSKTTVEAQPEWFEKAGK